MYPYLINIWNFKVMTFWVSITICFFLFVWMLYKMSKKQWFDFQIFKREMNLLWFFISILFFSRLFYIISKWNEFKWISSPLQFFVATDYNFSLMWGIFWFLIVFFILLKLRKEKFDTYVYGLVTSFIFILPLWFFWALLWGQVYWIDTNFWIEILYNTKHTTIPYITPIFPLPIIYSILFFILFCLIYISDMYFKEKNLLWYAWILIFSLIIFLMEFFTWKHDIFQDWLWLNHSQIWAIFLFIFWIYRIFKLYKKETRRWRR